MDKNWYLYCQRLLASLHTLTNNLKDLEQVHPITSGLVVSSCFSLLTAFACYLLDVALWIVQKFAWKFFYLVDIALWIIQESAWTFFYLLDMVLWTIQNISWIMFYLFYPGALVMIGIYFAYKMFPHTSAQWFGKPDRMSMEERAKQRPGLFIAQLVASIVTGQLFNVFVFSPFLKLMTSMFTYDSVVLMTVLTLAYGIYRQFFVTSKEIRNDGSNVNICVVCLANERTILLKPCKHFCMCTECAMQLTLCPMCNARITERERIYST